MSLVIKYYGMLAELAGTGEEVLPDAEKLTVGQLRQLIVEKYPAMREKKFKVAVDQKISEDYVPVTPGAEIALLPPFAGG